MKSNKLEDLFKSPFAFKINFIKHERERAIAKHSHNREIFRDLNQTNLLESFWRLKRFCVKKRYYYRCWNWSVSSHEYQQQKSPWNFLFRRATLLSVLWPYICSPSHHFSSISDKKLNTLGIANEGGGMYINWVKDEKLSPPIEKSPFTQKNSKDSKLWNIQTTIFQYPIIRMILLLLSSLQRSV